MKKLQVVFLIGAMASSKLFGAADSVAAPPATASEVSSKPKTGRYLMADITGYGGSLFALYGNGSSLNDTASVGLRGFVHFGNAFRLGAIGTMTGRTNTGNNTREMTGSLGIFGEFLLRFDPLIIGLGVKAAGAGYSSHDRGTQVSGTSYGYFNAMPFAELEMRLFEWVSLSIYGGYDYFVGNSASPNVSQPVVGVAVTFARY